MAIIRTSGQTTAPQNPGEIPSGVGYTPVGTIVAWIPGYFSGLNNVGYTRSFGSADSVAAANTYLAPLGWRVCDGGEPTDTVSPVWNAAGRKVPQINDKRFLQGSMSIVASGEGVLDPDGTIQGAANTIYDHTHTLGSLSVANVDISHNHSFGTLVNAAEGSHIHAAGTYSTNCSLSNAQVAAHTHTHSVPAHYHGMGNGANLSVAIDHNHGAVNSGTETGYTTYGVCTLIPNDFNNYHQGVGNSTTVAPYAVATQDGFTHYHSVDLPNYTGSSAPTGSIGLVTGGVDGNTQQTSGNNSGSTTVSVNNATIINRSGGIVDGVGNASTHNHAISGSVATSTGAGQTLHTHGVSGSVGYGNAPSATENRPQYLRCFMIIRFK